MKHKALVTVEPAPGGAAVHIVADGITVTAWLDAAEALTLADELAMACERRVLAAVA